MPDENKGEKIIYKTPPKISFILGILSGITIISVVGLGMMYSIAKSGNANSNSAELAGTKAGANTNSAVVPSPAPKKVDIKITSDDHVRGDKNAPVTMVEYSDFQCPYCYRAQATIDKILKDYKGKVRLVFRQFPLPSLHPYAQKAAEASECAADQGKFWEMHDKLFEMNGSNTLSVDNFKKAAKEIGLNTSTFNDCLDNGKNASRVKEDTTSGTNYGVKGTPATFVNGMLVSGAQPYDKFKTAIDNALAGK